LFPRPLVVAHDFLNVAGRRRPEQGGALWPGDNNSTKIAFHKQTSKRRRGFPSETNVKRGMRVVHCDKELTEKLGRNDLCPCGSGRRFQKMLLARRALLTAHSAPTTFRE
jgi:SEC-C motif-containing protein